MEQEKKESSEIKTHEEIVELLQSLKSLEEKIKNPELIDDRQIASETVEQEIALPPQTPEPVKEEYPEERETQIPSQNKDRLKKSWLRKKQKIEKESEKKIHFFSDVKREENDEQKVTSPTELQPDIQEIKIPRSTFILQLDNDGNLVGFPLRKSKPQQQKKGWPFSRRKTGEGATEHSEEEPAKGISGKLKRMASKLGRKKSSEGESSGGIGSKIKGIFRRKSKE